MCTITATALARNLRHPAPWDGWRADSRQADEEGSLAAEVRDPWDF